MLDATRMVKEKGRLLLHLVHGRVLPVLMIEVVEADLFRDEQIAAIAGLVLCLGFFIFLSAFGICLLIIFSFLILSCRSHSSSPVIIIDPTHFYIFLL